MFKKSLLLAAVCAIFTTQVFSQNVDEIIKKHTDALGGLQKLKGIKTLKVQTIFENNGMEIGNNTYIKREKKLRSETVFQGKTAITVYNGKEGWSLNPFSGRETVEQLNQDQLKEMEKESDIDGALIDYASKGWKATLEANEDIDGSDAYHIRLSNDKGDVKHYFIDKDSGYIVREKEKVKMDDGSETEAEINFSNYKMVDGIYFAFSMEQKSEYQGQKYSQPIKITSIEVNKDIPDTMFGKPESK